ncbi:hypothetical protein DEU56DRAFT_937125 [Suillus clintonianus]|uniref:uncharacterized protein n=1 Tax=Suillus clintonianus TaxID=1904413 RepID=UPI001B86143F|nr:uncharacterized protein DEU56DRAFT_937125 [Suillus clintonianus]KAG2156283.1 hypothetical protein DEU56DRAFT_937125 [Suillus clintonianus]
MFNASQPTIDIVVDRTTHALGEPAGAILVGVFIQFFFQGIIVIEAGQYYEVCYEDSWGRNLFVAFVTLLSLTQTGFEGYIAWKANVDRRTLLMIPRAWFALFLNGFISGINKLFLLRRCWRVTKGSWWIAVLFGLTVTTYAANILIAVAFSRLGVVNPKPRDVILSVIAFSYWTTAVLVIDVILSIIRESHFTLGNTSFDDDPLVAFFLWKNKTGVHHLDRALLRFCAVATESAVWPSLCVAVSAGLFFSHNANANRLVFVFLLQTGKLYTLSILRTLNAKVKLRDRMKSDDFARGSLGNWSWRQAGGVSEMSMDAAHSRSSFRAVTSGRPLSISIGPEERSVADSHVSVFDQHLRSPMPGHSNSIDFRSA